MYTLDTNEARKADSTGNTIREMGKYVGKFTQAEDIVASTGTKGIALNFEANGQKTRISLYTMSASGEHYRGYQELMAILTCLQLRGIKPVAGDVTRWDADTKSEITQPGKVFPELCNKPIGLLLETEDYMSNVGDLKTRMALKAIFQAGTELTASEILDRKTEPKQLSSMVAGLQHRPLKAGKQVPARQQAPAAQRQASSGFEDMDDDIPF